MFYAVQKQIRLFLSTKIDYPTWRSVIKESAFLSIYLFLFLFIFQPFGTFEYRHPYKVLLLAGYGLLSLIFYPFFKKLLQGMFYRQGLSYSLGLELFVLTATFILLTLLAFFYHGGFIEKQFSIGHLIIFTGYSCALWFPPAFVFLYRRQQAEKKKHGLNQKPLNTVLEIKGFNQDEHFLFDHSDIYYLKSNGNYVLIYFRKAGLLKHEILRSTLRQISRQLPAGDFIAVHRSFIANRTNFNKLARIDGKHFFVSEEFGIQLPVSRSYLAPLEKRLRDHR